MAEYKGPQRSDLIDMPLLSRFFYILDSSLRSRTKIYVLGGTALTLLGLRKQGSKDIDLSCEEHLGNFGEALKAAKHSIGSRKIFIPVTKNKKEIYRYEFPHDAIVQLFGTYLTQNKRLPEDFHKFAHKIKKIEWVIPEGGRIESMRCDELFSKVELYTLGFADIFCSKIFGLRERDREDIEFMIRKKGLYFRLYKKFILKRFREFWKANKNTNKQIKEGAVKTYNIFQEKYPAHLLPLKLP